MSKHDKREDIFRATLEIIAEHGFHGAPMAMIAEKADVGAGTIYRYFENKDVLISELFHEVEGRIKERILDGYSTEMPVRDRFLHLNKKLYHYFIEFPLHFRYIEQFHNSPYGVACRRDKFLAEGEKRDVFKMLFEEGVEQKVIKDIPIILLFSIAFGPIIFAVRDHILGFIKLDDTLIAQLTEASWDGVRR